MNCRQKPSTGCSSRLVPGKRLVHSLRTRYLSRYSYDESLAGPGPSSLAAQAAASDATRWRQPQTGGQSPAGGCLSRKSRPNDREAASLRPWALGAALAAVSSGGADTSASEPASESEPQPQEAHASYAAGADALTLDPGNPAKWRQARSGRTQQQRSSRVGERRRQSSQSSSGLNLSTPRSAAAPSATTAADATAHEGKLAVRYTEAPDADPRRVSWGFDDLDQTAAEGGSSHRPGGTRRWAAPVVKDTAGRSSGKWMQRASDADVDDVYDEATEDGEEDGEVEEEEDEEGGDGVTRFRRWPDGRQLVEVNGRAKAAEAGGALSRALGAEQRAVVRFNGGPGGLKGLRVLTLANIFMGYFGRALSFVVDIKPWRAERYDPLLDRPTGGNMTFAYRVMARSRDRELHDQNLQAAMRQSRFVLNMTMSVRQAWDQKGEVDEESAYDMADTLYGALSAQQAEMDAQEAKHQQDLQEQQPRRCQPQRQGRGQDQLLPPCIYVSADLAQALTTLTALGVLQWRLRQEQQPAVVEATVYRAAESAPRLDGRDGFIFAVRLGFEELYLVPGWKQQKELEAAGRR